ncbi:MAG: imidazole glycerol phosphate synthase subunit HisH [Desulfobacterales bacterium]|nr:imidazole glycerol phosphate synthase subunit HisH [Desulfobacterales bacterium]
MISIIDYNAGNLTSVYRAVNHLGFKCKITKDTQAILNSDSIIFPGVGAAGAAMESLLKLGLDVAIKEAFNLGKPILGICLGTQIIMSYSEENSVNCIGIINGKVCAFPFNLQDQDGNRLKIPQMGWNSIEIKKEHPVLSGICKDDEFYFVHGYYPRPSDDNDILASTSYGINFPSIIIGGKNLIATQFHPEKSGKCGLKLLKNFCMWQPC